MSQYRLSASSATAAAVAVLTLLMPRLALGQSINTRPTHPPVPYIVRGACPFECCSYREWTAYGAIPVRAKPATSAPLVFRTRNGERIHGDSGNVIVSRLGAVVALTPFRIAGSDEQGTVIPVPRGDTLYVLSYTGEGVWNTWYRGRVQMTDQNWDEPGQTYLPGVERSPARMVQKPMSEWWAHVTRKSGAKGWILMDLDKVGNVDACG